MTPLAGVALEPTALRDNGEAVRKGDSGKEVQRASLSCLPAIVMTTSEIVHTKRHRMFWQIR
jgi:hypothetical protein